MNGRFAMWRFAPALLAGAFIVSIPAAASAQLRWGRPTVPRDGACFYRDAGFRGEYFCVRAGEDLPYIPGGLNDEISSIRTFGRAQVVVFRDKRFSGRSEVFAQDVYNLRNAGWNDRLSSLRVDSWRGGRGYGDGRGYGSGYGDGRGYGNGSGYGNGNGSGYGSGYGNNDRREVVRAEEVVRRAYLEVLRREPDASSRGYVDRVMRDNWSQNDVERELRKSAEYRRR